MRTFKFAVHVPENTHPRSPVFGIKDAARLHTLCLVDAIDAEQAIDNAFALFSREELQGIAHHYGIPRIMGPDGSAVTDALGNPMYVSCIDMDFVPDDAEPSFVCLPCTK